jgi:hypothetical protein
MKKLSHGLNSRKDGKMNNAELDRFMAEEVMGYEIYEGRVVIPYFDGEQMQPDFIDWHPTTDIAQAILCLETWKKQKGSRFVRITLDVSGWAVYLEEDNHLKGNAHGEFECACSHALYQAVKGGE